MIKVAIDPFQLTDDIRYAFPVEDELQYIESRIRVREAMRSGSDLTVVVRNKKFRNWYESLKDYPDQAVQVEYVSPKSILTEGLHLPKTLSLSLPLDDSEIMELRLIETVKECPPAWRVVTPQDLESWILSACVDECWGQTSASLSHFAELLSYFLSGKEEPNSPSSLQRLLEGWKQQWLRSSVGELYGWLFEDPASNGFLTYALQVLRGYPEPTKRRIIDEIVGGVEVSQAVLTHIDRIPAVECSDKITRKAQLSDVVDVKWRGILKGKLQQKVTEIQKDREKVLEERFAQIISEAVVSMSGRLTGEIDALLSFSQENPFYFTDRVFSLIAAKFARFPRQIEKLKDLVAPAVPSPPSKDWPWERMSQWVITEYLPYKRWSVQQGKRDKLIEKYAEVYGDWLYEQYPKLKNELVPLNYGTWNTIKGYLQEGYQVLWIIIDNLCWFYVEDVIKAFKEYGFYPCAPGVAPQLCMLPSETKVSKTALVAGKLSSQIDTDNYKELFKDHCRGANIATYKAIRDRELKTGGLGQHGVTCCIINKLDLSSHQGFFDFEDEVKVLLSNIAKYLKNFVPPEASFRKFRIIISTDHGSCTIPEHAKGCTKPRSARMEREHKRFIYVDSEEGLSEGWYFLNKDRFGLREGVAIAKGYGFVGNKKPKGLVHGGMTPEETFIPHLEFSLQPLEIKGIRCTHVGQPVPLTTRKQNVEFLVRNENEHPIKNVRGFIPSHCAEFALDEIPPRDERPVTVEMALPKDRTQVTKENIATLTGYYTFECLGERKSGPIEIETKIMKIVDVSGTAEELLELT